MLLVLALQRDRAQSTEHRAQAPHVASADAAVRSVLADVRSAVSSARLIEVAPDLVGLTDVAEMVGVSRQNMRKLMLAHPGSFPALVHEGSASLWHLADVLGWLQSKGSYSLAKEGGTCGLAGQSCQEKLASIAPDFSQELEALVGIAGFVLCLNRPEQGGFSAGRETKARRFPIGVA
jgi:predicted DNA-binding transcriptional regulator AlpA